MNNLQLTVLLNAIDKISAPVHSASKSVHELSAKLKESKSIHRQLNQQNKQHQAAMKQYASAINPLKSKLDSLNQELEQAKQKAASYAQYMKNAQHPTAGFQKEVEKAKSAVKKLKQEQIDAANKLQQARQELAKSGISAEKLAQKQRELQKNTKSATDQIKNQEAALKKLNAKQAAYNQYRGQVEKLKDISGKAQIIGAQATAAGTTMTAPIVNSIRDFMSFEDVMAGVARQVPGLKDKFGQFTPKYDEWKNKIKQLSTELPLTTNQIGDMVTAAARMDIQENELEDFIRLNTQMATAFDAENPDELVELFGKVQKNFKLTTKDAKELADTINYLDDNAISKGTDIINFLNNTSGIGNLVKISEKNLAALGSTLLTAGNEASTSAKAIESTFNRLSKATRMKPVNNGLKALGLDPKAIQKAMVKDAQGTLMMIVEKIKKLPKHLQAGVISDIAGGNYNTQLAGLVANTEEWRRQIELANSEEAKNSMAREFQTRMTTLSAKWQLFKNRLFNVNSSVGASLKDSMTSLMDGVGNLLDKIETWIDEHPKLTSTIAKTAVAIGGSLSLLGALSLALSFILYPAARLFLGLSKLNVIIPKFSGHLSSAGRLILRGLLSPLKLIALAISPLGIALLSVAALIYKFWQPIKAFFGGFWEGLKSGLAPVLEKFQPLGTAFGVVVGWIEKAVKWFTDLLSPVQSTKEDLDAAVSAGERFGNGMAKAIEFILTPLTRLMDGIKWISENMPSWEGIKNSVSSAWERTKNTSSNAWQSTKETAGSAWESFKDFTGFGSNGKKLPSQNWSGGYTGNGGKYEPMGIVHGGEYVMTKEATSRLGVNTLNALNYGKRALIAGGLGISVATAAPVQVDTRAPISARPMMTQTSQPMSVNITIHAAQGMDERAIAQQVAKQMQRIENQRQARARSSMWDRA
ncbi:phage tail tape measure protein [Haemophilus influenzae]|nr:phage tail tape measure protein [Haemophilus influenzae]